MTSLEPDLVVADTRMRRASRRLTIAAWLCLIPALVLLHRGTTAMSREFLFDDPDESLAATFLVAALAPLLATWGRVGRRRRTHLALLGLLGAGLTVSLIGVDMDIVQRALHLGIETDGWWFECIVPRGNYQARVSEFGRLALVLRVEAALLEASPRRASRWRQLLAVGVGLGLAAAAGVPLIDWAIQDHVYTHLQSLLPSVIYLVVFAVFEVCMLLARPARKGPARPASKPSPTVESRPRPRPRGMASQPASPDPAALAQGHRALVRARGWSLVAAGVGLLGLSRLVFAGLELGCWRLRHHGEAAELPVCVGLVAISVVVLLLLHGSGRRGSQPVSIAADELPIELRRPGLRRLVELLDSARIGLEHGHDEVFEALYGDLELQFEQLDAREREWAKQRGLTRARLRSLLDRGVDHDGELDVDLRRALHGELSSMLAALRGLAQVDPYRADLDTRSFIAQLGLDWIRADRASLDTQLRAGRRSLSAAVAATLAAAFVFAFLVAISHPSFHVVFCMPGIDNCRVSIHPEVLAVFGRTLVTSLLVLPWAIGAAYRRVAARSFAVSRPPEPREMATAQPSQTYAHTRGRLARLRRHALAVHTWLGLALLAVVPLLILLAAQHEHWLARAIEDALTLDMTVAGVIVLALVCARPLESGLRRLYAKLWLAWLCAERPRDWSRRPLLVELVRRRVELSTAPLPSEAQVEALAECIAAAPLVAEDVDSMLAGLEYARGQLHLLDRAWLRELELQLVTCELLIAEDEGTS